jgi:hypothetical protein
VASVWGAVFSDGSGYVLFRGGGVVVYSIDGGSCMEEAYLGPRRSARGLAYL